jgi:hypothetical protein
VRYFVGYTLYTAAEDRRIISLVLGSSALLSLAILVTLVTLSVPASPIRLPSAVRVGLSYISALAAVLPAKVNFVLVFLWHHPNEVYNTLHGRCKWDIDVVWTGIGHHCDSHPVPWGAFIAAASVRLALTLVALVRRPHHAL